MSTELDVSKGHAVQLGRVLGILEAYPRDATGAEAAAVAAVREAAEKRAERIAYDVERQRFDGLDTPEYRTLATFCDQMANRGHVESPETRRQCRALAEYAAERQGDDHGE